VWLTTDDLRKPIVSGERQRTLVIYTEKCPTLRREKAGEKILDRYHSMI